jgi:hypothetical protein
VLCRSKKSEQGVGSAGGRTDGDFQHADAAVDIGLLHGQGLVVGLEFLRTKDFNLKRIGGRSAGPASNRDGVGCVGSKPDLPVGPKAERLAIGAVQEVDKRRPGIAALAVPRARQEAEVAVEAH